MKCSSPEEETAKALWTGSCHEPQALDSLVKDLEEATTVASSELMETDSRSSQLQRDKFVNVTNWTEAIFSAAKQA